MLRPGYVVIAPDKFKGSLSAMAVATQLRVGIHRVTAAVDVRLAPVADGGEGTVEAAIAAGYRPILVPVRGPLGQEVNATVAVQGSTAVVELAQASGLQLSAGKAQALVASSFGTGQLIRAALDAGCRRVILALGGSASTDGGAGMVQALGAQLTDESGTEIGPGGAALHTLHHVDLEHLDSRIGSTDFVVASDVDNPLLGTQGSADVFAPQKGATSAQVPQLEAGLRRWSDVVTAVVGRDYSTVPGAGAAGGVGFAAMALLGAHLQPGIDLVLEMIGFDNLIASAGLVVTGEGSLDEQSLRGKAPVCVARAVTAVGVPTIAVAGRTTLPSAALAASGFEATYTLQERQPDLTRCMTEAGPLLADIGEQIAVEWLLPYPNRLAAGIADHPPLTTSE